MINARAVGRESKAEKSRRFLEIVRRLEKAMPEAKIALEYQDELQLLVSVMLSAQCTDAVVNQVTPALFARYPTAAHYARSTPEILGELSDRYFPEPQVSERLLPSVLRGAASSDLPAPDAVRAFRGPSLLLPWVGDQGHPLSTSERLVELLPNVQVHVAYHLSDVAKWTDRVDAFLTQLEERKSA